MGKLLIATSINADGHIFPLAFAVVEEESTNCWYWFLYILRSEITQREDIYLIYDLHVGIEVVVRNSNVGWTPTLCTSSILF